MRERILIDPTAMPREIAEFKSKFLKGLMSLDEYKVKAKTYYLERARKEDKKIKEG